MARPVVITKSLAAASANNIALSQTPLAAGNLTLNGATVSGGVAILDTQRRVLFTFAANETGHSFVVYGTNQTGNAISETVAGTTAGTVATTLDFKTVTRISISAAATGAMTVGTNGVGATPWIMPNYHAQPMNLAIGCVVSGTVNYTIQYTYDDFGGYYDSSSGGWTEPTAPTAWADPIIAALAVNADTTFDNPLRGWRLQINSGTGSVTATGIQAGIVGA